MEWLGSCIIAGVLTSDASNFQRDADVFFLLCFHRCKLNRSSHWKHHRLAVITVGTGPRSLYSATVYCTFYLSNHMYTVQFRYTQVSSPSKMEKVMLSSEVQGIDTFTSLHKSSRTLIGYLREIRRLRTDRGFRLRPRNTPRTLRTCNSVSFVPIEVSFGLLLS
jgi:hypothetical protein